MEKSKLRGKRIDLNEAIDLVGKGHESAIKCLWEGEGWKEKVSLVALIRAWTRYLECVE